MRLKQLFIFYSAWYPEQFFLIIQVKDQSMYRYPIKIRQKHAYSYSCTDMTNEQCSIVNSSCLYTCERMHVNNFFFFFLECRRSLPTTLHRWQLGCCRTSSNSTLTYVGFNRQPAMETLDSPFLLGRHTYNLAQKDLNFPCVAWRNSWEREPMTP